MNALRRRLEAYFEFALLEYADVAGAPKWSGEGQPGLARVLCTDATYAGLIGASFNHLPAQHAVLAEQACAILEASQRSTEEEIDLRIIEERYTKAQRALDRAARQWMRSD